MTNRMHGLDILRLMMALCVLLYHFGFRGPAHGDMPSLDLPLWLSEASRYGYLGVSVFFMLSGFVIAFSAEGRTATEFAIARFARIYPTFILCMTVTFFVVSWGDHPLITADFVDYLANFLLVSRAVGQPFMDGVYWSIVLEVIFYGWVFALLLTGLFQKHKLHILLSWLFVSYINQVALHSGVVKILLLTEYSGFFIAGIAIYELRKNPSMAMWSVLRLAIFLSIITSCQGMFALEQEFRIDLSIWVVLTIVLLAPVVLYGFMSLKIPEKHVRLASIAGGVSFPLYLVHQHIGYVIFYRVGQGDMSTLFIVMLDLFVLALVIYLFFDRHFVKATRSMLTHLFVEGQTSGRNTQRGTSQILTPGE